jgi:hypothetical protein
MEVIERLRAPERCRKLRKLNDPLDGLDGKHARRHERRIVFAKPSAIHQHSRNGHFLGLISHAWGCAYTQASDAKSYCPCRCVPPVVARRPGEHGTGDPEVIRCPAGHR